VTPVLYEPVIRVPLLIAMPGQHERQDVHGLTSAVDLLPTLMEASGHDAPEWCEGRALVRKLGELPEESRSGFCVEAKSNPKWGPLRRATVALVGDRYKLIRYVGYDGLESEYELYDLIQDLEEQADLAGDVRLAKELQDELGERPSQAASL